MSSLIAVLRPSNRSRIVDLSAAFNTVDHDSLLLLRVLNCRFGVTDQALSWCSSYLNQRSQIYSVNTQQSGLHIIDCRARCLGRWSLSVTLKTQQNWSPATNLDIIYMLMILEWLAAQRSLTYRPPSTNYSCVLSTYETAVSLDVFNWIRQRLSWSGSAHVHASHTKLTIYDLSLRVDCDDITPVDTVRDLGVMLDCELSIQRHVSNVTSICFFHIGRLKQIRRLVGLDVTAALVSAFVLSRLDYCNAVLSGLPLVYRCTTAACSECSGETR